MNFADLFRFSESQDTSLTLVERLRKNVDEVHPTVGRVDFWACDLDSSVSFGHMLLELDRSSPYDDQFIVASIRYCKTLNVCWQRYVCCKELMHVFDTSLQRADNKDKFLRLMGELENNPIAVASSPMFQSERYAEWMALLVLCPPRLRVIYYDAFIKGEMTAYDIALRLRIPEGAIAPLMSDDYFANYELLTGESARSLQSGARQTTRRQLPT